MHVAHMNCRLYRFCFSTPSSVQFVVMTSTAIGLLNNVVTLWESFFMSALILVAGFAYYGVIGALTSSIQVRVAAQRVESIW